jgi:hypothetical protein
VLFFFSLAPLWLLPSLSLFGVGVLYIDICYI